VGAEDPSISEDLILGNCVAAVKDDDVVAVLL
jgi:hypothetical protein